MIIHRFYAIEEKSSQHDAAKKKEGGDDSTEQSSEGSSWTKPIVKATAYAAHTLKTAADTADKKVQEGIDKAAYAAGLTENPRGRTAELIKGVDPAGGSTRVPVRDARGHKAGAYI